MERLTFRDRCGRWCVDTRNGAMCVDDGNVSGKPITHLSLYEDAIPFANIPRAAELLRADNKGLCVVLPCEIDDTVWEIYRTIGRKYSVRPTLFWWSDIPRIGKTVFLTRAEAEVVLMEMKGTEKEK